MTSQVDITEFFGLLGRQTDAVEQLVENSSASLENKNIIKAPNSPLGNQNSANLNSAEKKKIKQIADIFTTDFFDEQKKHQKDTAEKTKITKVAQPLGQKVKGQDITDKLPKKEEGGLLSKIMDWVLGFLGMGALSMFTKGGLKGYLMKKFGFIIKPLKMVGKLLLKAIKFPFKALKFLVFDPLLKAGKAVWNFLKETPLFKKLGEVFDDIGKFIGETITKLKDRLVGLIDDVIGKVKNILPKGLAEKIPSLKGAAAGAAEGAAGTVAGAAAKPAASFGSRLLGSITGGARSVVGAVAGAPKEIVKKAFTSALKNVGGIKGVLGGLKSNVLIGGIIEGILGTMAVMDKKKELDDGKISLDDFHKFAGQTVSKSLVNTITTALGTTGGAILGSLLPGPGTFLGGLAGGYLGSKAGEFLGGLVNEYIFPPEYQKMVGEAVTSLFMEKQTGQLQDFIFSKGKAYPFSDKDDLVGLKKDGPMDKLLSPMGMASNVKLEIPELSLENMFKDFQKMGNTMTPNQDMAMSNIMDEQGAITEHLKYIGNANSIMIEYLKVIAQHTAMIAKGSTQALASKVMPPPVPMPPSPNSFDKHTTNLFDNRSSYARSAYALE